MGERLAVGLARREGALGVRLATAAAGGGDERILLEADYRDIYRYTAWSPDGSQIAFVNDRYRRLAELYVIPANGGQPRSLTGNFSLPTDPEPQATEADW